jgi:hypothetical protein
VAPEADRHGPADGPIQDLANDIRSTAAHREAACSQAAVVASRHRPLRSLR